MTRTYRWLDPLFALTLAGALLMATLGIWPVEAGAAPRQPGNGQAATEQRQPAEFNALRSDGIDVRVRQGAVAGITVQADSNLLPLLQTVVETTRDGRTLVLRWQHDAWVVPRSAPLVTVTVTQLDAVTVNGSGDVQVDALKTNRLTARISGSGNLTLAGLAADELTVEIKGSGDLSASGQAPKLTIRIAGSGDVNTDGLRADDVSVRIAGSGDAKVQAHRTLAVRIAGSGDVAYRGNPVLSQTIAGSGTVTAR